MDPVYTVISIQNAKLLKVGEIICYKGETDEEYELITEHGYIKIHRGFEKESHILLSGGKKIAFTESCEGHFLLDCDVLDSLQIDINALTLLNSVKSLMTYEANEPYSSQPGILPQPPCWPPHRDYAWGSTSNPPGYMMTQAKACISAKANACDACIGEDCFCGPCTCTAIPIGGGMSAYTCTVLCFKCDYGGQ